MLFLVSEGSFRIGAGILVASIAVDVTAHAVGWSGSEGAIHGAVFGGMSVLFTGLLLRGIGTSKQRREHIGAHR